ncbi:mersacidin/lichenicidin family type 2 lantibiotic [Archangium lansingense]|uniref:Mersacidin/lichenicidin family type 2 lantibiotic n=1 Tax=Archangium lansingense TaxID=2995310 RepID=A0ABT3ZWM7_9BACT|nr:mersacidin/lichenicidin family type 2 lantibiotic [Archangium lansinium]MCY1073800.1 mersacidin/lichenicidin family type 2 lantibiotic [Archangium lansinium]
MSNKEMIIRAWKDPQYRASLSTEERAALPESPVGPSMDALGEAELGQAVGGGGPVRPPRVTTRAAGCEPLITGNFLSRCFTP